MTEHTPALGIDGITQRVEDLSREHERLFDELISGERRFRRLARAVWKVQEEERRRLAQELHDGIGQTLAALKNQLEWRRRRVAAGEAAGDEDLASAVQLASQALDDTRELSRLLRPPVLDDLGLGPALRWLGRTLSQRSDLEVEVEAEAGDERLPPELETLVFRIAQEALTNALKHSGAQRAQVRLVLDGDRIRLAIQDHGSGFDVDAVLGAAGAGSGFGLRGILDRAELFGGRVRIRSVAGEGTSIEVEVPLPRRKEER